MSKLDIEAQRADPMAKWTMLTFSAWIIPVTLLVSLLSVAIADSVRSSSGPLEVKVVHVENLTAATLTEGAVQPPADPPQPPPPPGVPPRAFDPLAAFHHLELLNDNATEGFFRVLWEEGDKRGRPAKVWFEVDEEDIGVEFVVSAMVAKGDGTTSLLHMPLTSGSRTVFKFEPSPHMQGAIDLIAPQYELRLPPNGTISEETLAKGAWPGFVKTFAGTKVLRWETRLNASAPEADRVEALEKGTCDVPLWRNASDPVVTSKPGCEPYSINGTSWLVDVSSWLASGVVLSSPLTGARLVGAEAFPTSARVSVQTPSLEVRVSFARLPPLDGGLVPRAADDRIGYWDLRFTEVGTESGPLTDQTTNRRVDVIHRWRLEPADKELDAAAERAAGNLIAPAKPITYHIDPSVPERWRKAMKLGVELWQPAFERAGWKDAIIAVAPGDEGFPEDYSAADSRYASISWAVSTDRVYAVGPHSYDPRTGEILDADIMFAHSWVDAWIRGFENEKGSAMARVGAEGHDGRDGRRQLDSSGSARLARRLSTAQRSVETALGESAPRAHRQHDHSHGEHEHSHGEEHDDHHDHHDHHDHAAHPGPCGISGAAAAREVAATLRAKLQLDGVIAPGDPVPEEYVEAALVDVTMHEVGHTLGMRHNFKASTAYSYAQLLDANFTKTNGFASSVMDYIGAFLPSNRSLPVVGALGAEDGYNPFMGVVGAYDKHVIDYGYRPLADEQAGRQHAELAALAAEGAANRELAFSTDEDGPRTDGSDPTASLYDMSSDPLGFYIDQIALAQRLLEDASNRTVAIGEPWTKLLPAVERYMGAALKAGTYGAKNIGGFIFSKAHRGDPGAPDPMVPTPAADQWRALRLILQIISDDFWLPATDALRWARSLPRRAGWCEGLDVYCYGLEPAELLERVFRTRVNLLHTLVQPHRLAGLQQAEWEGLAAANSSSTRSVDEELSSRSAEEDWAVAWVTPPAELALDSFATKTPSVAGLLRTVNSVVSPLPTAAGLSATAAKARFALQRVWVSLLTDMSAGTEEAAAVATSLLLKLKEEVASAVDTDTEPDEDARDALRALARMLDLWERGLPVPA